MNTIYDSSLLLVDDNEDLCRMLTDMLCREGFRNVESAGSCAEAFLHFQMGKKEPDLVILDEPINGLDPLGAEELRSLFVSLAEEGKTLLISSHILSDISAMADTVGILSGHRICREFDMEQYRGSRKEAFEQEVLAAMKGEAE